MTPGVDAVDVCLPTPLHRAVAERALTAGLHVLLEKPVALTLEDADAIGAAARASGRVLMVGHVLRFAARRSPSCGAWSGPASSGGRWPRARSGCRAPRRLERLDARPDALRRHARGPRDPRLRRARRAARAGAAGPRARRGGRHSRERAGRARARRGHGRREPRDAGLVSVHRRSARAVRGRPRRAPIHRRRRRRGGGQRRRLDADDAPGGRGAARVLRARRRTVAHGDRAFPGLHAGRRRADGGHARAGARGAGGRARRPPLAREWANRGV